MLHHNCPSYKTNLPSYLACITSSLATLGGGWFGIILYNNKPQKKKLDEDINIMGES